MIVLFIIISVAVVLISEYEENPQFREKVKEYLNSIEE
jgi:preprotein translocase subunit SecG